MEKYQQETTSNLRRYPCSGIMGITDKISGEDSGVQAWCQIFGTKGMDTVVEDMRDGNRRDVGRRRWQNGLEERRQTGQILTENDYQPDGVSSLR